MNTYIANKNHILDLEMSSGIRAPGGIVGTVPTLGSELSNCQVATAGQQDGARAELGQSRDFK